MFTTTEFTTTESILLPTDFSDNNRAAVIFAAKLANHFQCQLLLLHVAVEMEFTTAMAAAGVGTGPVVNLPTAIEALQKQRDTLDQRAERLCTEFKGLQIEPILRTGNPAEVIVQLADEWKVGQIVMGSHGRTGLSRLLMGSVAESVVRESPCPVTIVKTQHKKD